MTSLILDEISALYPSGGGVTSISAEAKGGEITVLIGPNGSGKSTLLKAIAGLIDYDGLIRLNGVDLESMGRRSRAALFAVVDQIPSMNYPFSVTEVLAMGRLPHGRDEPRKNSTLRSVRRAAIAMDLSDLWDRPVTELSGGERQRVAIARAIVQDSPVMLMDEPSSALDPGHVSSLFSSLRGMANRGHAVIVTVHDVNLAAMFADKVWLMDEGRLVKYGNPEDILSRERLSQVYGVDFRRYDGERGRSLWFFELD